MKPSLYEQRSLLPHLAPPYLLPAWEPLPQRPPESATPQPKRYSRPGHASGWLEERIGNKKRKRPTTSYFYCYDHREDGKPKRTRVYVPIAKIAQVRQMVSDRRPIPEILHLIHQAKSTSHPPTQP